MAESTSQPSNHLPQALTKMDEILSKYFPGDSRNLRIVDDLRAELVTVRDLVGNQRAEAKSILDDVIDGPHMFFNRGPLRVRVVSLIDTEVTLKGELEKTRNALATALSG